MTERLDLAKALARFYHTGQKYGQYDYFEKHLEGVANIVRGMSFDEDAEIVAYLHDILEDTPCQYGMICSLFGSKIADAVLSITKRQFETHLDYLARCKANPLGCLVKNADSSFNGTQCYIEGKYAKQECYFANVKFLSQKV